MIRLKYENKTNELNRFFPNGAPSLQRVIVNKYEHGVDFKLHIHENPEIFLILGGEAMHRINGETYKVHEGDLIILNGNTMHEEISPAENPVDQITCELSDVEILDLPQNSILPAGVSQVIPTGIYFEDISMIFRQLYHDRILDKKYCHEIAQLNIMRLIMYIYRIINIEPASESDSVSALTRAVRTYIDEHYSEEISIGDLAGRFYASASSISHMMKDELGVSPINYQIGRRIGEAQRLLLCSDEPVDSVSVKVGYDNIGYFNRLFLKKTGMTPAGFRKLHTSDERPPEHYVSLENIVNISSDEEGKC